MAVLRTEDGPVHLSRLEAAWPVAVDQRERCLHSLVEDGLAVAGPGDRYALP